MTGSKLTQVGHATQLQFRLLVHTAVKDDALLVNTVDSTAGFDRIGFDGFSFFVIAPYCRFHHCTAW
jgi:hypothetical protein